MPTLALRWGGVWRGQSWRHPSRWSASRLDEHMQLISTISSIKNRQVRRFPAQGTGELNIKITGQRAPTFACWEDFMRTIP